VSGREEAPRRLIEFPEHGFGIECSTQSIRCDSGESGHACDTHNAGTGLLPLRPIRFHSDILISDKVFAL
jgi:hypothetical protein